MSDLTVILYYQNFLEEEVLLDNLVKCHKKLEEQNVNAYVIDATITTAKSKPLPIDERWVRKYDARGPFWSKENAINYFVKAFADVCRSKIVWMDSNVIIDDDKWAEKMSTMLDEKKLVHIGEKFSYLDKDGKEVMSETSGAKAFLEDKKDKFQLSNYNLGLGWGANKELFEKAGLFDFDISGMGGNEAVMFFSSVGVMKNDIPDFIEKIKDSNLELFFRVISYNLKASKYLKASSNVGFIKGKVSTLYSGKYSIEKYSDRFNNVKFSLMKKADLTKATDTDKSEHFKAKFLSPSGKKSKECLAFEADFWKYLNFIYHGEYKFPTNIIIPDDVLRPVPQQPPSPITPGSVDPGTGKQLTKPPMPPIDPRTIDRKPPFLENEKREEVSSSVLKSSLTNMGESWKTARREVYESRIAYERALRKEEIIYNNFIRGLDNL